MPSIEEMVSQLQQGKQEHFNELCERFNPLIYSWLKKIHQLYTPEKEDYLSEAHLILWECVQDFDYTRGVNFASYYKIKLYHWYGNQMQKKKLNYVALEEVKAVSEEEQECFKKLWIKDQLEMIKSCLKDVSEEERALFHALIQDKTIEEIAKEMERTKKTVQNKKYALIKKIRLMLRQDNYSLKPQAYQGSGAAKE